MFLEKVVLFASIIVLTNAGPVKLDLPVKYEFGKNPKILDDKDPEWIMPDEYMVVLDPNTNTNDHIQGMEDFFAIECNLTGAQCAKVIGKPIEIGKFKCYQLRTQEKDWLEYLAQKDDVLYIEPNVLGTSDDLYTSKVEPDPNPLTCETYSIDSWATTRINKVLRPPFDTEEVEMEFIHKYTGDGVRVYIMDSGIQPDHEQFTAGQVECGYDFAHNSHNCSDALLRLHGTIVAGVIGSTLYGMARGAKLVILRITNESDSSDASKMARALEWVANDPKRVGKPAIINLSASLKYYSRAFNDAVNNFLATFDIQIVNSVGNTNTDACRYSPSSATGGNTIRVAASTIEDRIWPKSCYGSCVDILAPGENVPCIGPKGSGHAYITSGTSISTPMVTSACALAMEENGNMGYHQLKTYMLSGATQGVISGLNPVRKRLTPNRLLRAACI